MLTPPWQLGPMSELRYSLDFMHSRGKTRVFPLLRQFLEWVFTWRRNVVDNISKQFWKLWMLLHFLSLASIIWVACCLRSCQLTSSVASTYADVASSPPFQGGQPDSPLALSLRLLASVELCSTGPASPAWSSREHLIWVDSIPVIPLAWCRMSLERLLGPRKFPTTLVTLSLQLWS
jgi:hypothetical protein